VIPILQAIQEVEVPVFVEPISVGGSGDFGLMMFAVVLAIIAAAVIGFMALSKANSLAMYREQDRQLRERDKEREQDKALTALSEKVADREHWLQHRLESVPVSRT